MKSSPSLQACLFGAVSFLAVVLNLFNHYLCRFVVFMLLRGCIQEVMRKEDENRVRGCF